MSISLYKVENKNIVRSTDLELDSDSIYIIVDRTAMRPKIWVWSGPNSKVKDRYFAGVSATTIKSQEKLYGSSIEVVEGGSEPEQFPKLEESRILAPSEEEEQQILPLEKGRGRDIYTEEEELNEEEIETSPEISEEVENEEEGEEVGDTGSVTEEEISDYAAAETMVTAGKSQWGPDRLWKQKVKSLMSDLSHDLEEIRNKIEAFISEL